jgi:hypothetical protein
MSTPPPVALDFGSQTVEDATFDLERFRAAPLRHEPFDFLVVPQFLRPEIQAVARDGLRDFDYGGVRPAEARPGSSFARVLDALRYPAFTRLFAEKFDVDLSPDALMITTRARCRLEDGQVHTDSLSKVLTALIYLEPEWTAPGGRLRLLKGPEADAGVIAEVPPVDGTLLAFRRSDRSWHGHGPYQGVRRSIMLNWMVSEHAARRELRKHALSAVAKRLFLRPRSAPERVFS